MSLEWQRVTEIVAGAVERGPDGRVGYVSQACVGNDELGAEVTALLAAHDQAGNFLSEPAFAISEPEPDEAGENVGRKLGPFLIVDTLGEGGMGVVLLAEDTRRNTKVTLKTLPPALARDAALRDYLERETKAVAAMGHPNIARVLALEEVYGQFYLVSEYVPGSTLRTRIDAGPIKPDTVVAIALQVAQALEASHSVGTVHRDLKPENIVCGESGVVKVLDLGLVRAPEPQTPGAQADAETMPQGSSPYWSPEQLDGPSVDFRSDLYSLGVVMYEMVAGRNPFAAPTPEATAALVRFAQPPPLSTVRATVPQTLDRVIGRCLERNRDERYQGTADLVRELNAMLEQQPAPAVERANAAPTNKPARARPVKDRDQVSNARGSWAVHQLLVVAIYAVSAYLAWQAEQGSRGMWSIALLAAMIVVAGSASILRMQLLTTERLGAAAFGALHRRAGPVVSALDLLVALVLLTMASGAAWSSPTTAFTLGALALALAINAIAVEPSRTRAAFPELAASLGNTPSTQITPPPIPPQTPPPQAPPPQSS